MCDSCLSCGCGTCCSCGRGKYSLCIRPPSSLCRPVDHGWKLSYPNRCCPNPRGIGIVQPSTSSSCCEDPTCCVKAHCGPYYFSPRYLTPISCPCGPCQPPCCSCSPSQGPRERGCQVPCRPERTIKPSYFCPDVENTSGISRNYCIRLVRQP